MFGKRYAKDLVVRSTDNETDRRLFLKGASAAGLGVIGAAALGSMPAGASTSSAGNEEDGTDAISDAAILNFALNLEYLEGQFYHHAVYGTALPSSLTTGRGHQGQVVGGRQVPFKDKIVKQLAHEIAVDEREHVAFLRGALGSAKVATPHIDIKSSFTAAARAAGLIGPTATFDPYASDNNFLLAAFIFEDVGVTAYKGAAPLIKNKTYLGAAAGILAVEAYHASSIRLLLVQRGLAKEAQKISNIRDAVDGKSDDDRGVSVQGVLRVAPTDRNGLAFSRTPAQVLNTVYLTPKRADKGGFFPYGTHGLFTTSSGS